ncbi:MAG: hypothetical protein E6J69_16255 [Deltaproteobacteria bacterium]|nr:MAG: hypothetical protein E6J69_16255 [Deltaproteobacteria bacterium]
MSEPPAGRRAGRGGIGAALPRAQPIPAPEPPRPAPWKPHCGFEATSAGGCGDGGRERRGDSSRPCRRLAGLVAAHRRARRHRRHPARPPHRARRAGTRPARRGPHGVTSVERALPPTGQRASNYSFSFWMKMPLSTRAKKSR